MKTSNSAHARKASITRHVEQIDRVIQSTLVDHAASSMEELLRDMIEAMIDAHTTDPELYELLLTAVPHKADGSREFPVRLHGAFLLALSARASELKNHRDLNRAAFIVANMVEALSHGAVLRRPATLSLAEAKEEVVKAVLAYLRA